LADSYELHSSSCRLSAAELALQACFLQLPLALSIDLHLSAHKHVSFGVM
jgi:hypothetical protein